MFSSGETFRATLDEPGGEPAAVSEGLTRRRWRWSLYFIGWTLVGFLFTSPIVLQSVADQIDIPRTKVWSEILGWYLWGLLFPLIWWSSRRFPLERKRFWSRMWINLGMGLVITLIYVFLTLVKRDLITSVNTGKLSFSFGGIMRLLPTYLLSGIEYFLMIYCALVAVIHALSYYQKYRERELKASRLETQLARAHLDMLKMQLHPHFLFNTLNAVSALMHRDVDAADRMIARLSDLLRLSLDKDDRHLVPLHDELEFLDRYLSIEKIRFRDRLVVDMDIDPLCLDAQVPKLILQPLVENSIKHGIAASSAAGKVGIRTRRKGNRLVVVVSDNGPGLPDGITVPREGVGLANTRARLEQLYPADHRFELRNAASSGLEVLLEIPFEEAAPFPVAGAA